MFAQLVVNSLIAGSIYALIASGFSLITQTNRFIHFAHGSVIAAGAYFLYAFFSLMHLNFWLSVLLAVLGSGFLGYVIYNFLYNPLKKRKSSNAVLLVASVGLLIFLENMILLVFGANVKSLGYLKISKGFELAGAMVTSLQISIIFAALVLLGLLFILAKKTRLGVALRSVADNDILARILGIDANRLCLVSFIVGSALAGFAGIFIGLEQNIEPVMGTSLMIKGFTAAVIGGMTSLPGAVLGAYLLGFAENFGIWFLPSGYKDAIAFVLLFAFLLFRPNGILGIYKGIKE